MNALLPAKEKRAHEEILAKGLVEVATELRMVDASEFVALIRNDEQANISDLVNSSSELYFKQGALKYGLMAEYQLDWSSAPSIVLDMEFAYNSISAFFKLTLSRSSAGIQLLETSFPLNDESESLRSDRLRQAIEHAKLTSRIWRGSSRPGKAIGSEASST